MSEQSVRTFIEVKSINPLDEDRVSNTETEDKQNVDAEDDHFSHQNGVAEVYLQSNEGEKMDEGIVKEVPDAGSWSCRNLWLQKRDGYGMYFTSMRKLRSNVFRIHLITERIALCDSKAIQVLFNQNLTRRDKSFGVLDYNPVLLEKYTPSIFSNDEEHEKKKRFLLEFARQINTPDLVSVIVNTTLHQFSTWLRIDGSEPAQLIEDDIDRLTGYVVTRVMLGKSLSNINLLDEWLDKSLELSFAVDFTDADEVSIAEKLNNEVDSCPVIKQVHSLAQSLGVDAENMIKEVVFATVFNAYGGMKHLAVSCLVLLLKLPMDTRMLLTDEAVEFLQSSHSKEDLDKMQNITNFVYEVIRLHPPAPKAFGRARESFVLHSTTGAYRIEQGSLLCGEIYVANRDPELFPNPDQVDIYRYDGTSNLNNVLTFGGNFTDDASTSNRKCVGQHLSVIILKVFVAVFLNVDVVPASSLKWTGKKAYRFTGCDKPLKVKKFVFIDPKS